MRLTSNKFWRAHLSALLALAFAASPALALQGGATQTAAVAPAAAKTATLTATERELVSRVKLETVKEVTTTLSSKEMEGRGTAQPGADKAAAYLAERFSKLGLKPLGDAGTYLQKIKFKVSNVLPGEATFKAGDASLKYGEDFILSPGFSGDQLDVSGGVVFAGYGVSAPDLKRDDLAGLDLKGKVVVVSGKPNSVDEEAWKKATSPMAMMGNIFGKGGASAVVITNIGTTQQPFAMIANYLSRRRVALAGGPEPQFKAPPVILAGNSGVEKLFAGTGTTYAKEFERLQSGETASRDLGKTATVSVRVKREEGTSSNVVAVLEGSDPKLKEEAVVYTAHYDAYGVGNDGRIYPGAADNALGTSMIVAIAEALSKSPARPRRSVIFLAVTGEEYGLLGAKHWVNNPTWPLEKVAANINHDSAGTEVYAPVKRVVGWGQEHSDLGAVFEDVVNATGNVVTPDPVPEENAFVRSDHYEFVKKGVPALMMMGGPAGDASMWVGRMKKWMETDYHMPTDTVLPGWDWTGPQTLAQVGLLIGWRVANADTVPAWKSSSPFNKPRGGAKPITPTGN